MTLLFPGTRFETRRLCRLFRITNGGTPTPDVTNWGGDIVWVTPSDLAGVDGAIIGESQRTLTESGLASGSKLVPKGSVILSTRAPVGYVAVATTFLATNQGCKSLVPTADISSHFVKFALYAARPALEAMSNGTTFKELGTPQLAASEIPLPPRDIQDQIVALLDLECAQIDSATAELDKLTQLLVERRSALIDSVFNPMMYESLRLKFLLSVSPTYGVLVPEFTEDESGVGFVRVTDLSGSLSANLRMITSELSAQYRRTILTGGELLLGVVGYMGICRVAPQEWIGANVARAVAVLRPRHGVPTDLLRHWITSRQFMDQAAQATDGDTAQPTLGMGQLARFSVSLPPENEWTQVAHRLNELETDFSCLHQELAKQRVLLQERRQVLIIEAVTGQLEVA